MPSYGIRQTRSGHIFLGLFYMAMLSLTSNCFVVYVAIES